MTEKIGRKRRHWKHIRNWKVAHRTIKKTLYSFNRNLFPSSHPRNWVFCVRGMWHEHFIMWKCNFYDILMWNSITIKNTKTMRIFISRFYGWIIGNVFCVHLCCGVKYGYRDFDGDSSDGIDRRLRVRKVRKILWKVLSYEKLCTTSMKKFWKTMKTKRI